MPGTKSPCRGLVGPGGVDGTYTKTAAGAVREYIPFPFGAVLA